MTSRTDIQNHFGRTKVESLAIGTNATTIGSEWKQTSSTLTGGSLGGSPINEMRYTVVGKTCHWTLFLSQGTAGVQSASLVAKLPVPARTDNSQFVLGHGHLGTDTNGNFLVIVRQDTQNTCFFAIANQTIVTQIDATTGALDNNGVWVLSVAGTYEIA